MNFRPLPLPGFPAKAGTTSIGLRRWAPASAGERYPFIRARTQTASASRVAATARKGSGIHCP